VDEPPERESNVRHQWNLPGPEQSWFTLDELVVYLGIGEKTIKRLISEGRFPQPYRITSRSQHRWSGLDVAAYVYLCSRCKPDGEENLESAEN
jgi:predicted DNA-binding transcriptional regulator AlpA